MEEGSGDGGGSGGSPLVGLENEERLQRLMVPLLASGDEDEGSSGQEEEVEKDASTCSLDLHMESSADEEVVKTSEVGRASDISKDDDSMESSESWDSGGANLIRPKTPVTKVSSDPPIPSPPDMCEYEKIREKNIAEREALLRELNLVEELSKYKKDELGGGRPRKVGKTSITQVDSKANEAQDRGGNRNQLRRNEKCTKCESEVPRGMMKLHNQYLHYKLVENSKKVLKCDHCEVEVPWGQLSKHQRDVHSISKSKPALESVVKCRECEVGVPSSLMNLHRQFYHKTKASIDGPSPNIQTGRPALAEEHENNESQVRLELEQSRLPVSGNAAISFSSRALLASVKVCSNTPLLQPAPVMITRFGQSGYSSAPFIAQRQQGGDRRLEELHPQELHRPQATGKLSSLPSFAATIQDPRSEASNREDRWLSGYEQSRRKLKVQAQEEGGELGQHSQLPRLISVPSPPAASSEDLDAEPEVTTAGGSDAMEVKREDAEPEQRRPGLAQYHEEEIDELDVLQCPLCPQRLDGKEMLIDHVSFYHGELKVTFYVCPKCQAKFQSQFNLVGHMQGCGIRGRVKKEEKIVDHANFIAISSDEDVVDLASNSSFEEEDVKMKVTPPVNLSMQALHRPRSQAELQAEERRGISVSVVTWEQEELANVVKEVENSAKKLQLLAGVFRRGGNVKKAEVKVRNKEVVETLYDVSYTLNIV